MWLRIIQTLGMLLLGGVVAVLWWRSRVRRASYADRQRLLGEERYHDRDERLAAGPLPYFKREFLLTRPELLLFRALTPGVSEMGLAVAPKVRLADIINCDSAAWSRGFGAPISWKHVDFVLFHPLSGRTLLAIELDDASHDRPERRQRDEFLDAVLAHAGIPLLRMRGSAFSPDVVRRHVCHAPDAHYGDEEHSRWRGASSDSGLHAATKPK